MKHDYLFVINDIRTGNVIVFWLYLWLLV